MKWWETVESALKKLGGRASLEDIYREVKNIRLYNGDSLPISFRDIVRKELEYNSSDSSHWQELRDLFFSVHGIGNGIWGLRSQLVFSPAAVDMTRGKSGNPGRDEQLVYRIIRDTVLARKIKALHHFECQICGITIDLGNDIRYAEAHHIIPLGRPHDGPDIASNIIVVCPNHHAMLDLGAICLNAEALQNISGHFLDSRSIEYHNTKIVVKDALFNDLGI